METYLLNILCIQGRPRKIDKGQFLTELLECGYLKGAMPQNAIRGFQSSGVTHPSIFRY
jgi:hypothetical protein